MDRRGGYNLAENSSAGGVGVFSRWEEISADPAGGGRTYPGRPKNENLTPQDLGCASIP